MNKFAIGIGLVMLTGAALVAAQPPQPPSFEELDTDGNGTLSQEEVGALFARFAGRGPGADAPPGGGPNPAMVFGRWDADGDGVVTREEFDARPRMGPGGPRGPGGERGPRPDGPPQVL